MQGVTTALVAFLFVCVIFPNLVKNRPQYYAAFAAICIVIILDALAFAIGAYGFRVFVYVAEAFLQVAAILMLFLACGGLSWRELGADMKQAFEVIRRGGEEKEVIIPLSGDMARLKAERDADRRSSAPETESGHERIVINDPTSPTPPSPAGPKPDPADKGSIPLEP
ncbi:MAG TPA: hypothetical protein VH518_22670 [Tepidisphaeraceae bacterium]|jgi:hypothetical protein